MILWLGKGFSLIPVISAAMYGCGLAGVTGHPDQELTKPDSPINEIVLKDIDADEENVNAQSPKPKAKGLAKAKGKAKAKAKAKAKVTLEPAMPHPESRDDSVESASGTSD